MSDQAKLKIFQPCTSLGLVGISIFGAWIPYMFKNKRNFASIISYLNTLSSGILIGVAFLHILTESGEVINEAANHYPVSYCIVFAAILGMAIFLSIGHVHTHQIEEKPSDEEQNMVEPRCNTCGSDVIETATEHRHVGHQEEKKNWTSVLVLMTGLFIHDISEGIALGIQQEFSSALFLFAGIALHKWCDASCQVILGIKQGLSFKQNLRVIIPLVLATPIAQMSAFFATLVQHGGAQSQAFKIVEDVFMSLACGSFLTIAFVEILGEELHNKPKKEIMLKGLTVAAGFTLIALSKVIEVVTDSHDHDHDHVQEHMELILQ